METSDGAQVTIVMSEPELLEQGMYYDIVGRVEGSNRISVSQLYSLGNVFDAAAYDKMVVIASAHPDIFCW